jgi:exodeoxyribonuclease-3
VRLPHVLRYLERRRPDVLALQETKLPDEKFPRQAIEEAGYRVCFSGQKTYNGVAILSRAEPTDETAGLPDFDDAQKRLIAATVDGVRIVNVYVPNGQEVGSGKYAYKFRWLDAFERWLERELADHERLVVLGDFNIAPTDADVHDPKRWRGKIMCSDAERERFANLLELGLADAVRVAHPEAPMFTWWDYRLNARRRGWGLRIDHILISKGLRVADAGVHDEERDAERPSDHAPVWAELESAGGAGA